MSKDPRERPPFVDVVRYLVSMATKEVVDGFYPRCPDMKGVSANADKNVAKVASALHAMVDGPTRRQSQSQSPMQVQTPPNASPQESGSLVDPRVYQSQSDSSPMASGQFNGQAQGGGQYNNAGPYNDYSRQASNGQYVGQTQVSAYNQNGQLSEEDYE